MNVGPRSKGYTLRPSRPDFGTSRAWARNIGDWRYSFTLVNMPSGEVRWFVRRYDTPISQWADRASYTNEEARMKFDCYWHPYRTWTFKPTD